MKWTKEVLRQIEELSLLGKSNKEIAEIIGSTTARVSDVRSRYGLTNAKLKGATTGSKELGKCFADDRPICTALVEKNCEGCNFFKTQEQVEEGNERTKVRLDSLKDKAINIYY